MVWSRKRVIATECPKSLVTAESLAWVEEYYAWKLTGGADYRTMGARQWDAFSTLEQVLTQERNGADE